MRRVSALVEVDGQVRQMELLPNNPTWSAQPIAEFYRCRWSIEALLLRAASRRSSLRDSLGRWSSRSARLKELEQTLQLADFLGHNANARLHPLPHMSVLEGTE